MELSRKWQIMCIQEEKRVCLCKHIYLSSCLLYTRVSVYMHVWIFENEYSDKYKGIIERNLRIYVYMYLPLSTHTKHMSVFLFFIFVRICSIREKKKYREWKTGQGNVEDHANTGKGRHERLLSPIKHAARDKGETAGYRTPPTVTSFFVNGGGRSVS